MKQSMIIGILVMFIILFTLPLAMADGTFYLVPQDSAGTAGGSTYVDLMVNVTESFAGYQIDINFDNTTVDIPASGVTYVQWSGSSGPTTELSDTCTRLIGVGTTAEVAGIYTLANLTLIGQDAGVSDIHFTGNLLSDPTGDPITNTATNGTYTIPASLKPDLIVTKIDPSKTIFVNATNIFTLYVKNQGTANVTGSFDVSWNITNDASTILSSGTETITGLNIGEEKSFDFNWKPTVLQNTSLTVTADSGSTVTESDETNNTLLVKYVQDNESGTGILPLSKWGYGGNETLTTYTSGEVFGDLIYTFGDSVYLGGYNNPWSTYTVNFTLGTDVNNISGIAEGIGSGTVKEARLYMYYNWYRYPDAGRPADPEVNMTMTFNGSPVSTDAKYEDAKGFSTYSGYKYGTFVYNVTSNVTGDGTYQAVLSNAGEGDAHGTSIYSMALLVIYEDSSKTLKQYHIAEGHDLLKQYYLTGGRYQYRVVPEDATSTVSLPAVTGDVTSLFTVTAAAADGDDKSRLYFNTGNWSSPWPYISGIKMGTGTKDVTSLDANPNTVAFQDRGDGYSATNAILISEIIKPDLIVTKIDPSKTIFVNATNIFTLYVKNQGTANVTGSFDVSWNITNDASIILSSGTETITGLNIGEEKSFDFNWKPTVLQNTSLTVTADSGSTVTESDETNNDLSVSYVQDDESGTGILPLSKWGYGGNETLTTYTSGEVLGDLIYTFGDSVYLGGYNNPWSTYTVNFTLGTDVNKISEIAEGIGSGTVKEARLYMYYNWYRYPDAGRPADPEVNMTMTFNGSPVSTDAKYEDAKGFSTYSGYKYGTFVYNVTSNVTGDGTYQAVLSNAGEGDAHGTSIYSMALLVIYEDSSKTLKQYHIAEGHDLLKQYYLTGGRYQYRVVPEDATSTVSLPAVTGDVTSLFTVTAAAADGDDKSRLYFNTGNWSSPWPYISGIKMGTGTKDVTSLDANPNTVSFQDRGDGYSATNAILISEIIKPDLIVTKIDPSKTIFVNATNIFTLYVKNQGTANVTGSFDVSWNITNDASTILSSGTETITGLNIGEEKSFDFNWKPTVLQNTSLTVTADSGSTVTESDETNNTLLVKYVQDNESGTGILPLSKWGYGGNETLTTYTSGEVFGDLIYTFGDSVYLGGYNNPWSTYTVNFTLGTDVNKISEIAEGIGSGTVKEARLYMYYNWYRYPDAGRPADPEVNMTMTFNGSPVSTDAKYEDAKGFSTYSGYKYGTFVYNVTSNVTGDGTYQAVLSNAGEGDAHGTSIYSMALLVIYEDSSKTLKQYHIAEGHDLLKQYYLTGGRYQYRVVPEDATSTVSLPAVTGDVTSLFTVTAAAADGDDKSRLYFNTGNWNSPWPYISGIKMGTGTKDVTSLDANPNTVAFQDRGDGYSATNAILISEIKPDQPSTSSGGGSSGGGGASGEASENILISETEREYINQGSKVSYSFDSEDNMVGYINFTGLRGSGRIAAKVEMLSHTSTLVDRAPQDIVYMNMNIGVGNSGWATSSNIANPTISFRVEKSWVTEQNIDKSTISMSRYSDGKWNLLETTMINEDANYLYFRAVTSGFSPFAVTGKKVSVVEATEDDIVTKPTTSVEETPIRTPDEGKPGIPGFSLFAGLLGLLVIMQLLRKKK